MPKAYSYLRFSTPEQMQGDSFRRQSENAARYAREHGLDLDVTLTFQDLGVSAYRGRNANRGALRAFLDLVEEGRIEAGSYLIVESLDRVSRQQVMSALGLFTMIIESGVVIVTLTDKQVYSKESIAANPYQLFISLGIMIRANEESVSKGVRVKESWKGRRAKAAERVLTAMGPSWLILDREKRQWTVIEARAEVVKRIYEMRAAGAGYLTITETLNRENVPVFETADRKADRWYESYVKKILVNPAVIGTYVPHELEYDNNKKVRKPLDPVENYYPAVVDVETYRTVQAIANTKSPKRGRHAAHEVQSILAGLARCPLCGGTMTRKSHGKKHGKYGNPYLVCNRAKTGAGCVYRSVVLSEVERCLVDRARQLRETMPAPAQREGEIDDELDSLEMAIAGAEENIDVLLDQLTHTSSPSIRERIRSLESAIGLNKARRDTLLTARAQASAPTLIKRVDNLVSLLVSASLDIPATNHQLRQLVEGVEVDWRWGKVVLHWHHGGTSELQYGWPDEEYLKAPAAAQ
ncbi:DNA invertase Pin-like site-specific DNA recombinase [Dongia mobilis]|uniref:DNA invertase Pin-like site-specific DNA recombinase n=1 Tax=Dongia mobilis TaxID=578943 RepID=A0A4R6WM28_9PROT|nr:recombinase family protein [Dongia mobilis]TDQ82022.1 DNA invertase Pin-like site-specific DNA recombinase [Dongia mobilis]